MARVFLLFVVLLSNLVFAQTATVVEKIIAIVNSEIILMSDFETLQKSIKQPGLIDESFLSGNIESLKSNRRKQLDYLIAEKIVQSEIKRLSLNVSSERVEQELQEIAKKNGATKEDLLSAIKSQGISISEYRAFLKNKIEKQSLIDAEIVSKLRVSDEEAFGEYLKKNPKARVSIEEFSVSHIFFNPKKGGMEAAKNRANSILNQLNSGKKFEELAESNSEDPNFSSGGFLGTFRSGEFIPEFESIIGTLNPGQISGVVQSKRGFHILKLISKKVGNDLNFEKQKQVIKANLLEVKFQKQFQQWLQSKKEEAYIRINDPNLNSI